MKKALLLVMVIMVSDMMVSAQSIDDTVSMQENKPQIQIKVNKVYDENGNVIGYDSTYVWSYSNSTTGKGILINPDTLFSRFKPFFDEHFQMLTDPFNNRFFNDSSMYFDFFNNNRFFNRWQDELFNRKQEVEKMDSLKQLFFKKYLKEQKEKEDKGKIY